ncbi:flagellar hook-basal body protein [Stratiformator vulcanicus]|uniref:Flagellar basal-body rod protein FlgG n=1 Tax=Stratiformator vulcanicus TaxID=2527980 RepID=A0A517R3W1_9PLAN|nr:flagellar hook basal-body protein [Stratiformator vulcanicus]QDT38575.1 Flagellar basal-body rod protein FlgG [Stratiformator vulcanicus]
MIYGLYQSAQGAEARQFQLDVVANNLANAGANGFKRSLAVFAEFPPYDPDHQIPGDPGHNLNEHSGGMGVVGTLTDFSQGPLQETGGRFDLAITGPGFFVVSDAEGDYLTRGGSFALDPSGQLVTADHGLQVKSVQGRPINISADAVNVSVSADGSVIETSSENTSSVVGQMALAVPDDFNTVEHLGENLYQARSTSPPGPDTRIRQGYLEGSGTNPVVETVQMIEASRAFEANLNMIRFQEEALGRLLQSAGGR